MIFQKKEDINFLAHNIWTIIKVSFTEGRCYLAYIVLTTRILFFWELLFPQGLTHMNVRPIYYSCEKGLVELSNPLVEITIPFPFFSFLFGLSQFVCFINEH